MKLSEYKNEEALDLLAEIIEPASEIFGDKEMAAAMKSKSGFGKAVKIAIKNHKSAVLELLAKLDGKSVDEFECNVFTLPAKLLEILNDKDLMNFFGLQGQKTDSEYSGSVRASTQE